MCLTLPGHVIEVDEGSALVELDGRRRRASTLLHPQVQAGDWVIVAAGTIIERLDPSEADFIRTEIARATEAGSESGSA